MRRVLMALLLVLAGIPASAQNVVTITESAFTLTPGGGSFASEALCVTEARRLEMLSTQTSGSLTYTCAKTIVALYAPVPDVVPPTISLSAPAGGATVFGTMTVAATATDNVAVVGVQFQLDGANLGAEDTTFPYTTTWATTTAPNAAHVLTAVARDAAGNTSAALPVSVTVTNAIVPTLTGLTQAVATSMLTSASLVIGPVSSVASQTVPTGVVISQSPAAGLVVAPGSAVSLVVSSGPPVAGTTTSFWSNTTVPPTGADSDTGSVELGVKFTSTVAGTVTAVRFYKASTNTGTHSGTLWSSTGTKLATVTFTGETASGWQQMAFATPVVIAANTTYVVSYHAPVGRYNGTLNFFTTAGFTVGPLKAINSVYRYGSTPAFPNTTYQNCNYWVDLVFRSTVTPPPADTAPPVVSLSVPVSPLSGAVSISATATDNVAVAGVQFKLDGANLGPEDTTAPYAASWNTATATNAGHTVSAVARDAAGNTATASSVVTVLNVVAPPPPTALKNSTSLGWDEAMPAVSATAAVYKAYIDASMTGVPLINVACVDAAAGAACTGAWPTMTDGVHTIALTATASGLESVQSTPLTFTFQN